MVDDNKSRPRTVSDQITIGVDVKPADPSCDEASIASDPLIGRSWPPSGRSTYQGLTRLTDGQLPATIKARLAFAICRRQRVSGRPMVIADFVDEERGSVYLDIIFYEPADMMLLLGGATVQVGIRIRLPRQPSHRAVGNIAD